MPTRTRLCAALALGLLAVLAAASLCVGAYPLTPGRILALPGGGDPMAARVFFTLRLPRTALAALAGLALGAAGGVYQTVFRNPLASPDLTGVAGGASLGAAAAIVLGAGSAWQIMGGAFLCGLLSLAAVLGLVRAARAERTAAYVLAGILVSALAEAGVMLLKTLADPERELAAIEYWTMGSLAGVTAGKLAAAAPPGLAAAPCESFAQALGLARATDSMRMQQQAAAQAERGIRDGTRELKAQHSAWQSAAAGSDREAVQQTAQELLAELEQIERSLKDQEQARQGRGTQGPQ